MRHHNSGLVLSGGFRANKGNEPARHRGGTCLLPPDPIGSSLLCPHRRDGKKALPDQLSSAGGLVRAPGRSKSVPGNAFRNRSPSSRTALSSGVSACGNSQIPMVALSNDHQSTRTRQRRRRWVSCMRGKIASRRASLSFGAQTALPHAAGGLSRGVEPATGSGAR